MSSCCGGCGGQDSEPKKDQETASEKNKEQAEKQNKSDKK
jgi:hypothetical protein